MNLKLAKTTGLLNSFNQIVFWPLTWKTDENTVCISETYRSVTLESL